MCDEGKQTTAQPAKRRRNEPTQGGNCKGDGGTFSRRQKMIDLNKIEAAAKAATPGLWEVKPSCNEIVNMDHGLLPFAISQGFTLIGALYEDGADATHIATANPAIVLEMVRMSRERDAVLRQALEALENGKAVRNHEGGTMYQPPIEDEAIAAIRKVLKP